MERNTLIQADGERDFTLRVEAWHDNMKGHDRIDVHIFGDTDYVLTPEQAARLRDRLTAALDAVGYEEKGDDE